MIRLICRIFLPVFLITLTLVSSLVQPAEALLPPVTVPVGRSPQGIAVNETTNRIYVANSAGGSVTVINGDDLSTTSVAVGNGPCAVAVNSSSNMVYVVNLADYTVSVLSGANNSVIATINVGTLPIAVAVNQVTNKVYVVNAISNDLTVIDGAYNDNSHTSTIAVGSFPYAVALNSVTNQVYVANYSDNNVTVIDGAYNDVAHSAIIPTGTGPSAIAVNQSTNMIYVATSSIGSTLTIIKGSDKSTSSADAGTSPVALAVNPKSRLLYAVNSSLNRLTIFDLDSSTSSFTGVGRYPQGVAINQTTNRIYVANYDDDTVQILNGPTVPADISALSSSTNPARYAEPLTITATVTGNGPTGLVTFKADGATIGSANVSNGSAEITVANLATGSRSLTAEFAGDPYNQPASTAAPLSQSIEVADTVTSISASANPLSYGQSLTLTATVKGKTPSNGIPAGSVQFKDGAATLATVPLDGSGKALYSYILGAGSYSFSAVFSSSSSDYNGSSSASLPLSVTRAQLTVKAESLSKLYHDVNPPLTYSYSGFVNGEGIAAISGTPTISTTATLSSPVGSYPITVTIGSLSSNNYNFIFTNATLTVEKLSQVISFPLLPAKQTDSPPFTIDGNSFASSGLALTFSSSNPSVAIISGRTVTIKGSGTTTITASQAGDDNYKAAADVSQTLTVGFGSTGPSISLSTLDNGATSSIATINITGTVTAPNGLQQLTCNGTVVTVGGSGSFSYPVTLVPGSNIFTLVATDKNGLTGSASRTFTLDATAPIINLTSGQTDNSITSSPQTTVSGNVDTATSSVLVSINGAPPVAAVMTGTGFTLPVTLSSGLNTIIITATDASGKSSSIKQSVILNATLSLAITNPPHDLRSSRRALTLTGIVSGSAPVDVTVAMDGQSFTPTVTNNGFSQLLTFAGEKNYPILVTATDGNGNSVSVTRNISYAVLGDLDGSGAMTLGDILTAFYIANGMQQATANDLNRCDVAPLDADGMPLGNGVIDIGDVVMLLRFYLGLNSW